MKFKGFTLIELMVVVAIVAILASVAIPSYQAYVREGRRAECRSFALDIASRQERFFTQNGVYATSANYIANLGLSNGNQSENSICSAEMGNPGGTSTFLVTVTPSPADSECTTLTLSNIGQRGATGTVGGADASECWR